MKTGKLIVFSAPSGSGKTTLVSAVRRNIPELHFSISATSRAPRGQERNGVDYFFLTPAEFRRKIVEGGFIEYEEVYRDTYYGTLKSQVEKQLAHGVNLILDIDVKGAVNVKKIYGDKALLIFIQPPSIEVLKQRLISRGTDSMEVIRDRIDKASYELTFAPKFDCVIINDRLEKAEAEVEKVVDEFLNR